MLQNLSNYVYHEMKTLKITKLDKETNNLTFVFVAESCFMKLKGSLRYIYLLVMIIVHGVPGPGLNSVFA